MAYADAYGKRYDVCRRLCSSRHRWAGDAAGACGGVVRTWACTCAGRCRTRGRMYGRGSACIWCDRVFLASQRLFHV